MVEQKNIEIRENEKPGTTLAKYYAIKGDVNPVTIPIIASSTYILNSVDHGGKLTTFEEEGWLYSRWGNPTTEVASRIITQMEQAHSTIVTSSGMAAVTTALITLLKPGDHIVAPNSVYGGTNEFLNTIGKQLGFETTFIDASHSSNYLDAIQENTKILYSETPANPSMRITDLEELGKIAQKANCISMTDSTFASPINQNPLTFGINIVLHSATKYLGGHSDLIAGTISVDSEDLYEKCYHTYRLLGGTLSAFDSYLLIRGLKTLDVRMKQHNKNALNIARHLENHPSVAQVHYPGIISHPHHELAKRQMKGYGGMLSFEVKGGIEAGRKMVESLKLINLAVSLGGVESLIEHPATMTHSMVPKETREKAGITDGLIRFSVGIEDVDDLIKDINQALET